MQSYCYCFTVKGSLHFDAFPKLVFGFEERCTFSVNFSLTVSAKACSASKSILVFLYYCWVSQRSIDIHCRPTSVLVCVCVCVCSLPCGGGGLEAHSTMAKAGLELLVPLHSSCKYWDHRYAIPHLVYSWCHYLGTCDKVNRHCGK